MMKPYGRFLQQSREVQPCYIGREGSVYSLRIFMFYKHVCLVYVSNIITYSGSTDAILTGSQQMHV